MPGLQLINRTRRLIRIYRIACRYRLDQILPANQLPRPGRMVYWLGPWHLYPKPTSSRGARIRAAMEELGPVFVKFGQILSTRPDLLPRDIADELRALQDRVQPFPSDQAMAIIERELRQPISEVFSDFEETPLASASIAQVHAARLKNGQDVVVKVIRPDILPVIGQDIEVLFLLARLVENFWSDGKRLHPVQIVSDYRQTILDELDLQREAGNLSQFRRNFKHSKLVYMPEVYWEYSTSSVLTMERIYGVSVDDVATLREQGVDLKVLADKGVEILFTQVFRDNFFHADMHPGNVFVNTSQPENPSYISVDCGIVGSLTTEDQIYLAKILIAFFEQDYHQIALLHVRSGWMPASTPVHEFEGAIRTVCEPIFEKPLGQISFGQLLLKLFETARRFDMEVQPQLVLLQKTLLNIEGLGRQLYPDLDLWSTGYPFLESWMSDRLGPPGLLKTLRTQLPEILEQAPEVPQLVYNAIKQAGEQQTSAWAPITPLGQDNPRNDRAGNERSVLAGVLMLGAAALLAKDFQLAEWLNELPVSSWILGGAGLYLLFRKPRSKP